MSWLLFAFLGPILWAISTHFDKYLVERYFKDSLVAVLLIFTALTGLFLAPLVWLLDPNVLALPLKTAALMTLSGILYMAGLLFYLQALQFEEASVVVPFSQVSPMIGYALGYFILGETLTLTQIGGGLLIIGGASLVALKTGTQAVRFKGRLTALMLTCAFSIALSSLIFKFFAIRDDFWPTTFWMFCGQAIFGIALLALPRYRVEFTRLIRSNPYAVLAINGANELINLGGSLGMRFALTLAPLSLVQAVSGTTTIFVFAFGAALTLLAPSLGREDLSLGNVVQKGISALLVALGVFLVNAAGD